jgi:hypothetical protein
MLEINRLNEITFNHLEKAVNNTISNKIFIRNNFIQIPNLTQDDLLIKIHELFFSTSSHCLIKTVNNIEWTPVKLYLTGYYFVNLYNKFWLVSHNTHKGFVVEYYITHQKYVDIVFINSINLNISYLPQNYHCSKQEILNAIANFKLSKEYCMFIKQVAFLNSNIILKHYIYKKNNEIYYFQFSNENVYKPFVYLRIIG